MKFLDGIEFDTSSTKYHMTRKSDGWYVVGQGMLCPVASVKEGRAFIQELLDMDRVKQLSRQNPEDV